MYKFTMPIYWTQEFKTKPNKTHLVGMNFYRNAYHHVQNTMKKDLEAALRTSNTITTTITGTYTLQINLYYKNSACDGSNIIALVEKVFLDFLQSENIVIQDNVTHHLGTNWAVAGQDKLNPRAEITVLPTS